MMKVEQVSIGRRLIMPLAAILLTIQCGAVNAQGAFPAPLPGRTTLAANDPFPPVNGAAPVASLGAPSASFPVSGTAPVSSAFSPAQPQASAPDECMQGFLPLRQEAEKRGKLIKAASDRHAPAEEACKLIGNFAQSETKMLRYVETHAAKCGIPPQISDQLRNGHKNTEAMQQKICAVAQQQQQQQKGPAGPTLSEVLGSATSLPTSTPVKHASGSVFDTLQGNVLER
nr:hypothetical protein [Bradyrhizobium sp. dw_411]